MTPSPNVRFDGHAKYPVVRVVGSASEGNADGTRRTTDADATHADARERAEGDKRFFIHHADDRSRVVRRRVNALRPCACGRTSRSLGERREI